MLPSTRRWLLPVTVCLAVLVFLAIPGTASAGDDSAEAGKILDQIRVNKGICVLLSPHPNGLAVALARQSELTVYVQLPTEKAAQQTRWELDGTGLLGTRIYVEEGPWSRIHLADNLADALVVTDAGAKTLPEDRNELARVVRPLGTLLIGQEKIVKPYPKEVDDWTHPFKGPDNNPQSYDQIARAPYLTQFLAEPWYVPFPEITVTSAGRVFKAFGHVGFKRRDWPWVNTLVAINGYNGTMLWKRSTEEGFNIHRNTMIATPEILYFADSKSCKLIDPASGEVKDEIVAPQQATGPVWKWMALEDGILYAVVGEEEPKDQVLRGTQTTAGWPWAPMTKLYDQEEYVWGFGRTVMAIDPKSKQVLWMHKETEPIDGRAVAMKNGRIYYYCEHKFVACLDAKEGKPLWRTTDPELLKAIGPSLHAQRPDWGYSSSCYMKCTDEAVYFAGPQREQLVAISAENGKLLWNHPHGNFQLVIREEGLYAMGRTGPTILFEPLTGKIVKELAEMAHRGNCTRATGTIDSIFARGHEHGGTMRLPVASNQPQRIALMRPGCHDGVIAAGGQLYWGPWMCDCSLSLVGLISLGPAGDFDFQAEATDAERLQSAADAGDTIQPFPIAPGDWPSYRADNQRNAASAATIPGQVTEAWRYSPKMPSDPAAPITAGGKVFLSGSDGVVRAINAQDNTLGWKAFTGGPITYPPAIEDGRLFVGSGDGWIYAFEAATGRRLWRFRAAPVERKINLYGKLASTWPVAGGVLVDDGVVYAAAGVASYDGTHVYALDAKTGRLRWQNNTSGQLAGEGSVTGVSVQGHLLLHGDKLYLAGGNVVSPAVYDIHDGRCLNTLENEWNKAPRGRELFLVGENVIAFERLLYAPKQYWQGRYFAGHLLQGNSGNMLVRAAGGRVVRIEPQAATEQNPAAIWDTAVFQRAEAMALGNNAVVIAGELPESTQEQRSYGLIALSTEDGQPLWRHPLPSMPLPWGLALDSAGRVVLTLQDGSVLCLAAK